MSKREREREEEEEGKKKKPRFSSSLEKNVLIL